MYVDDAASLARSELDLDRTAESFVKMHICRKMRVSVNKSKVMVVEREGGTVYEA